MINALKSYETSYEISDSASSNILNVLRTSFFICIAIFTIGIDDLLYITQLANISIMSLSNSFTVAYGAGSSFCFIARRMLFKSLGCCTTSL